MRFFALLLLYIIGYTSYAQYCSPATSTLAITPSTTTQFTPYYTSGIPAFSFSATAGCSYTFSTCGESTNDTYLRLYSSTFALLGQWDDQCGLQSTFTWTCPANGTYYVHLSRFVCTSLTASTRMSYVMSCPTPPCSNPVVDAGNDIIICEGASGILNGSATAGTGSGGGSGSGTLMVTISGSGWQDMVSWTLTNSTGGVIGSGGPYAFGATTNVNIATPGNGPYTFFLETQGTICDNTVNFSISCNGNSISSGVVPPCTQTTVLVASCTGTGGGGSTLPLTYSWSPATALSSTTVLNPTASPTTTTTYTLTATQGTCSSQDQVVVTVTPNPTVSGAAQSFCSGDSVTLSVNGSPNGGAFLWTPNGQTTSTISVSPSSTTTYNVQYTIGGCSANSTITASLINGLDFANIQSPGTSMICEGDSITVFGQVFEPGLTETVGQAAGISVQFGINSLDSDPSTWPLSAWSTATYNPGSQLNPNNDEYQATIGNLPSGTYYFAFSYTYNGCMVYGGYNASGGGFWNGTTNINGILVVNPNITPSFSSIAAICEGSAFPVLPTSSLEGITGTWLPLPNNLQTTSYTFTPTSGLCALPETAVIVVNSLPTVSINNITNTTILNCTQTSIGLNAIGSGSFTWSNGINPISTGSSLNVTSPGIYTLGILDQNGCVANTSITISQDIANPTASIINNSNVTELNCTQTSISLTGAGGATYSWSNGINNIGNASSLTLFTPGTYTLTVTGANGCTDTEVITITQNNTAPTAAISNGTTILDCNTTSIALTASGGQNYSWSNATGVVGTNAQLQVTTAGTYIVTVTESNGCSDTETITITSQANTIPTFTQIAPICTGDIINLPVVSNNSVTGTWSPAVNNISTTTYTFTPTPGLCANTTTMTVVVNPYPNISAQNDTICDGSVGTITTQVDLIGGSYSWMNNTNNQANLNISPSSSSSYSVIYDLAGCTDTATAEIIVKPVPIVQVQDATICEGQTGELIASANLPNGVFLWDNGSTNDTLVLSPTNTTNLSVTYTINGCSSIPVTAMLTVNPLPVISINNQTICSGDPVTLQASANPTGTYFWGANAIQGNPTYTFTPIQDTTIEVFNVLNGCSSDTLAATVTVLPLPVSTFSANIQQGCAPLSVDFTADVLSNTSYTWQTSNQLNASGAQTSFDFQANGSYSITLTATLNGCSTTNTLSNMIEVDNYPIASFEPSAEVFTQPNQQLSFWNNSIGASTYQWNFGEGGSSTDQGPSYIFNLDNEGTTVTLFAYSNLGCLDTVSLFIGFDPGLVYYIPNTFTPDGDQFNQTFLPIFTAGIDPYNFQFLIYNRWGEMVFESRDPSVGWDGSFGMQGNPCQNGTYTYLITVKLPTIDKRQTIKGHVNLIR
jgi:gliding motility-associated-like protein